MCEAARRTVERVGIDNVTGAAIKDSLDSMGDFDLQGIATVNYTNGERRGTRTVAVYEIQDGKIVRVSDWMTAPILVG